ncbi:MAG TPA: DUF5682 family protein [Polyangiaceae bacterium]|nr:DUF5682 family protein [Polyangiaceae bacterium]
MTLTVIGVRHHSPACARLVEYRLRQLRPRFVLIEGPADMNARMSELQLRHQLPLAIFSFYQSEGRYHASWSPFCEYSPEWVALSTAREIGAEVRFMDLPAWSEAFDGVHNRYADDERRYEQALASLCDQFGAEGMDALWDHLFEQPLELEALSSRLQAYFAGMREVSQTMTRDALREAYMARCIAWSIRQGGDVVAVCGGFHKPELERLHSEADGSVWPEFPAAEEDAKHGSYLVPYSFKRLDSFVGYESGMPSPAYYQAVWECGPEHAAQAMLEQATRRLRKKKQAISTADLIGASAMALGLARLRGHAALSRCDLLDGFASAVLKSAQTAVFPWNQRGKLPPGTDPILVEVVAALSGERSGRLAPETPRPPLLVAARAELTELGLWPEGPPRKVRLKLTEPVDLIKSRALHRLRVLAIPGLERVSGPTYGTDPVLEEEWSLRGAFEAESALIEASAYGATLDTAAVARLEERLGGAPDVLEVSALLAEATFVGIERLSSQLLTTLGPLVSREPDFGKLGKAQARLLALYRHDTLLGSQSSPALGAVLEAAFARGLWLFEGLTGPTAPADTTLIHGVMALRDSVRFLRDRANLEASSAAAMMHRKSADAATPPALRGAALGYLWSLHAFDDLTTAEALASSALRRAALPATLGDFLAGLFALAREEIVTAGESALLATLDELLADMALEEFLVALPALRMAHAYFPPRERERIALRVLALHGQGTAHARDFLKLSAGADTLAAARSLEARVDELERRFGLEPSTESTLQTTPAEVHG